MPYIPTETGRVCVPEGGDLTRALTKAAPHINLALFRGGVYHVDRLRIPFDYMTLSAYGDRTLPPPRIVISGDSGINLHGRRNIRLQDLEIITSARCPIGTRLIGCRDILFDRVSFKAGGTGMSIEDDAAEGCCRHISIVSSAFSTTFQRGTALTARNADGLSILDSVFDGPTVHVSGDCRAVSVSANLFCSSLGTALMACSGGTISGNLFLDNHRNVDYGVVDDEGPVRRSGVEGKIASNVFIGGRSGIRVADISAATISDNVLTAGAADSEAAIAATVCTGGWAEDAAGIMDLRIRGNRVWSWPGGPWKVDNRLSDTEYSGNCSLGMLDVQKDWEPPQSPDLRQSLNGTAGKIRSHSMKVGQVLEFLRRTVTVPAPVCP